MSLHTYYGFWEFWEPYQPAYDIGPGAPAFGGQKVTFDGANKLIIVNYGVTEIDVRTDIYSDWKEWMLVRENGKYALALSAIGGDPITDASNVGITYFLENGWRIKMWEGDHQLSVAGNLFTREPGEDPYIETEGNYKVTIATVRSNLVDLITPDVGDVSLGNTAYTQIANTVWDKPIAEINTTDTTGDKLKKNLTKNQFLALDE